MKSETVSLSVVLAVPGIILIRDAVERGDKFASACRTVVPALIGAEGVTDDECNAAHEWIKAVYDGIQKEYKKDYEHAVLADGECMVDANAGRRGNATAVLRNALRRAGEKHGVWVTVNKKGVAWGPLTIEESAKPAIGEADPSDDAGESEAVPEMTDDDAALLAMVRERLKSASFRNKLAAELAGL